MLKFRTMIVAAGVAAATTASTPARADTNTAPKTMASFPSGNFLENLTVTSDGSVVFTSYFAKSLQRLKDGELQEPLAILDAHPVGIIATANGFVVTAHGKPFTDAPAFLTTNKVLLLSKNGKVRRTFGAPDARFLNGLVALSPKRILIADSVKGIIWAFDPVDGALTPWLEDETLTLDSATQPFRPATNGLKVHRNNLYVSNSSRGAIYRVKLGADGKASGKPKLLVQPGPVDDFSIESDGTIYAATHGDRLLKISPDGTVNAILEEGCDACTSVAIVGRKPNRSLLVLTTGKLLEGGKMPAKVLQVDLR